MKDNTLMAVVIITMFAFFSILAISESPKLAESHCKIDHHEYQIELVFDTVLIYDNNRFVGSYYIVGDTLTPFETILADDNR